MAGTVDILDGSTFVVSDTRFLPRWGIRDLTALLPERIQVHGDRVPAVALVTAAVSEPAAANR